MEEGRKTNFEVPHVERNYNVSPESDRIEPSSDDFDDCFLDEKKAERNGQSNADAIDYEECFYEELPVSAFQEGANSNEFNEMNTSSVVPLENTQVVDHLTIEEPKLEHVSEQKSEQKDAIRSELDAIYATIPEKNLESVINQALEKEGIQTSLRDRYEQTVYLQKNFESQLDTNQKTIDIYSEISEKWFISVQQSEKGAPGYDRALAAFNDAVEVKNSLYEDNREIREKIFSLRTEEEKLRSGILDIGETAIDSISQAYDHAARTLSEQRVEIELSNINSQDVKRMLYELDDIESKITASYDEIETAALVNQKSAEENANYKMMEEELGTQADSQKFLRELEKIDRINEQVDESRNLLVEYYRSNIIEQVKGGIDVPSATDYFFDDELLMEKTEGHELLSQRESSSFEGVDILDAKLEILQKNVDYHASILELKNKPEISLIYDDDYNFKGEYKSEENLIRINVNSMDDNLDVMATIAHECRHAYQNERANYHLSNNRDLEFAKNIADYKEYREGQPYVDFIKYQTQLVEKDAEAYADNFIIALKQLETMKGSKNAS